MLVPASGGGGGWWWGGSAGDASAPDVSDQEAAVLKEWSRRLERKVRDASCQARCTSFGSRLSDAEQRQWGLPAEQVELEGKQWEHAFKLELSGMDAEQMEGRQQQQGDQLEALSTQMKALRHECAEQRRQLQHDRQVLLAIRDDTAGLWEEIASVAAALAVRGDEASLSKEATPGDSDQS
mmetsp:Transcript_28004/g.83690  ORF Transcript_28004/g.83690 Transcript_28004/m.83690 type:complete len:181 (-) Transcript_28004:58-600(-)